MPASRSPTASIGEFPWHPLQHRRGQLQWTSEEFRRHDDRAVPDRDGEACKRLTGKAVQDIGAGIARAYDQHRFVVVPLDRAEFSGVNQLAAEIRCVRPRRKKGLAIEPGRDDDLARHKGVGCGVDPPSIRSAVDPRRVLSGGQATAVLGRVSVQIRDVVVAGGPAARRARNGCAAQRLGPAMGVALQLGMALAPGGGQSLPALQYQGVPA